MTLRKANCTLRPASAWTAGPAVHLSMFLMFLSAVLFLSACGPAPSEGSGVGQSAADERPLEPSAPQPDPDDLSPSTLFEAEVPTTEDESDPSDDFIPDGAPKRLEGSAPADRQQAQAQGVAPAESIPAPTEPTVGPSAMDIAPSGNSDRTDTSTEAGSGQPLSQQLQFGSDGQAQQVDIIVPSGDSTAELTDAKDGNDLDERILAEILTPANGCATDSDGRCDEIIEAPDQLEVQPDEAQPPSTEDDCGIGTDCWVDPEPTEDTDDFEEPEDSAAMGKTASESNARTENVCEERPWARGCDGPAPDAAEQGWFADGADELDTTGSTSADVDPTIGVEVPAEVVDILLTDPADNTTAP